MLGWWYSRGWMWLLRDTREHLSLINSLFAVRVLLKTWFAPWKQISTPQTFRNFFQSAIDNLISRLVGAVVRTAMLFVALLMTIVILSFGIVRVVLWAFVPPSVVLLPLYGLTGGGA